MSSFHQNYILYFLLFLISIASLIKFKQIAYQLSLIDKPNDTNMHKNLFLEVGLFLILFFSVIIFFFSIIYF